MMQSLIAAMFILFMQASAPVQIQAGTAVRPETTTVGQHFVATIRVRVPAGTRVTFPLRPDSAAHVDSAGVVARTDSTIGGFTESTANYVLAAWDTGSQSLGLDSIEIGTANGDRFAKLNGFQVYVRSVLPKDTTLRKPKPFRPVVPIASFNWLPWLIAALVALACVILAIIWRSWRRRIARGLLPFEVAEREFARIEALNLIDAGESERYAVEMVGVARVYLARTIPLAARSATTHELATSLRRTALVPVQRLVDILDATDLIKFARKRSTAERAREIGAESRRIVSETDAALAAEAAAQKKLTVAADAQAKAKSKAKSKAKAA